MKKILLILAVALVWSANAEAGLNQASGLKLSKGYKINRASDDAAGYMMSLGYNTQGGCVSPSRAEVLDIVKDDGTYTYSNTYAKKPRRGSTNNCANLGTNNTYADADIASEMVRYTKNNILQQAESRIRDTDMAKE